MFPRCTYIIALLVVLLTVNVPFKWMREWQFIFDEIKAVPVSNGINWYTYLDKPFTIRRSRHPKQNFHASKTKKNGFVLITRPKTWIGHIFELLPVAIRFCNFSLVQYLIMLLSIDLARKLGEKKIFCHFFSLKSVQNLRKLVPKLMISHYFRP